MENTHIIMCSVCGLIRIRIEKKQESVMIKIILWGLRSSIFYPNRNTILEENDSQLVQFVWKKSIGKRVLLGYLNSPDLYRLLSRSWPCWLECTPWSGCQWWGSCTVGTPPRIGSHIGCSDRCTRPPHCTWCSSRQTGQTSLVGTVGRWSGDLEMKHECRGGKKRKKKQKKKVISGICSAFRTCFINSLGKWYWGIKSCWEISLSAVMGKEDG